jgi:hypothetical protein
MHIEINAPDLPLAQVCEAAELFADYLGLQSHYNGAGAIVCRGPAEQDIQAGQEAKPLVAIVVGDSTERAARAVQALRRVLQCAPKGAVLATDGRRTGILPAPAKGWRELRS